MRFLTVAERELRAAARRRGTYRVRWITAAAFFALLVWLGWAFNVFSNRGAGSMVFRTFSVFIFVYCLFVGAAGTADCISCEKRDGTLGLLFLTNLNSAEIVGGKLCSHALALIYSLLAIFPVLALPVLIGGITFGNFWCSVLALANGLFFAIAAGFVASALCVRQFSSVALATGLALFFGMGVLGAAQVMRKFGCPASITDAIAAFCPLHTLLRADDGRLARIRFGYWSSLAIVSGMSWTWLALVAWRVARTWRDRPKSAGAWSRFKTWQRLQQRGSSARANLRRRLLEINPFFWLDGRRWISSPVFMILTAALIVIAVQVAAPYFGRVMPGGTSRSMVGFLFAWWWTGLAIHALVLYYAAMAASQRLAEDKQAGALELILSTPTNERSILRGLWLAYGRRMFYPAILAVLVHFFFIWQVATMAVLDPPGELPPGITPGQLLWHAFLNQPFSGFRLPWFFGFVLRVLLLTLMLFALSWVTLGWSGRWLGLRMKHPGLAPLASVATLFAPPILLFSFAWGFLANAWNFNRMPPQQFLPVMMWIAFGIHAGYCLLLSVWAASHLRRDFRIIVTSRFQPPSHRRWWRPDWRIALRLAAGAAVFGVVVALSIVCFYGYQNWRSRRTWTAFQSQLKQKSESLDLAVMLRGAVPDDQNFARTPAFQALLNKKNAEPTGIPEQLKQFDIAMTIWGPNNTKVTEWIKQGYAPLDDYAKMLAPKLRPIASTNLADYAPVLLQALQSRREMMRDIAAAAHLPSLQLSTNRDAFAVLDTRQNDLLTLERLHLLFQIRASASLAVDRVPEAADDLLTGLRLAGLARQLPDARSTPRVQSMLARSLQPLWEGLADHQWTEPQLAAFQKRLAEFNLLSDYTNAVRRVVLANIELWRAIPEAGNKDIQLPDSDGNRSEDAWALQPRAWWFGNCIELHRAGEKAIAKVDAAGARVHLVMDWNFDHDLPLNRESQQLLQQYYWAGPNPVLVCFAQNAVNQAIIACALERYRIANAKYPETLEQLVPAYLGRIPNDIVRGRPMIYQHLDDAHFILRGVGPNETDDRHKKGPVLTPPVSDDWLWSYPTNAPTAPK